MSPSSTAVGGRFQGTLLDAGDRHRFWVDLKAGEQVTLGVFAASPGNPDQRLMFELWRPDGENGRRQFINTTSSLDGGLGSGVFGYRAVQSGRHELVVTTQSSGQPVTPTDFVVQIYRSSRDDDPVPPMGRATAQVGDEIQGTLGGLGDADHVTLSLVAGQEVVLQLRALPPSPGASTLFGQAVILDPALNTVQNVSFSSLGTRVKLEAETAGTYTVVLRPGTLADPRALANERSGEPLGRYALTVANPQASDEPDTFDEASRSEPLPEGQVVRVVSDGIGDRDILRIDLRAGQVIEVSAGTPFSSSGVTLQMLDTQGKPAGIADANLLRFEADRDGSYGLLVTGRGSGMGPSTQDVRWTTVQPVDVGGRVETAAALSLGQIVNGTIDMGSEVDVFALPVKAGQRLSVLLTGEATLSASPRGSGLNAVLIRGPEVEGMPGLMGDVASLPLNFDVQRDGSVHLQIQYASGLLPQQVRATYQLKVIEQAPDDHAPSFALATPLVPGQSVFAHLETADLDVFSLPLKAGDRVQWTVRVDPSANPNAASVRAHVFEAGAASPLMAVSAQGTLTFEFTARNSGLHALALDGKGSYTVQTTTLAPVELAGSRGPGVTLVPGEGFSPTGVQVQARPGATVTLGTPRDDQLTGTAGPDAFEPRAGNDHLDGGPGLDTLRLPPSLAGYRVQHTEGQWQFIDLATTSSGTKTVWGIERVLDFAGARQHLALDLNGHAGDVARLAGALLGKAALADRALLGVGIYWLDQGVTGRELADAAVTLEPFLATLPARTNEGFVRQVHQNVTGQPPTAEALGLYVGWLDRGEVTQGELLWLASQSDLMALQIDLVGLSSTGLLYQGV